MPTKPSARRSRNTATSEPTGPKPGAVLLLAKRAGAIMFRTRHAENRGTDAFISSTRQWAKADAARYAAEQQKFWRRLGLDTVARVPSYEVLLTIDPALRATKTKGRWTKPGLPEGAEAVALLVEVGESINAASQFVANAIRVHWKVQLLPASRRYESGDAALAAIRAANAEIKAHGVDVLHQPIRQAYMRLRKSRRTR